MQGQTSLSIQALMALLSATPSKDASFREERHLAALDQPLFLEGRLRFRAPARLEQHTTSPKVEDLVVDGDSLSLDAPAEDTHYRLDLNHVPKLAALVEAVRGVLAGDIDTLRAHYSVGLSGDAKSWQLTLVPIEPEVRALVKVIGIGGSQGIVRSVETVQANGDLSRMTIQPESD